MFLWEISILLVYVSYGYRPTGYGNERFYIVTFLMGTIILCAFEIGKKNVLKNNL